MRSKTGNARGKSIRSFSAIRPQSIQSIARPRHSMLHPADAVAGVGAGAASPEAVAGLRSNSIGTLLGSHVLRDGEIVIMILKPSFWFIFFNSAYFAIITVCVAMALAAIDHRMNDHFFFEASVFCIAGRLMWAVLQWMGRLYILTDRRVLRITGVFGVEIFDCPLRKVVRTRIVSPSREKIVGAGSIEIIPSDESMPSAIWQTIARPLEIHDRLVAAINRAKQNGTGCDS